MALADVGHLQVQSMSEGTLHATLDGVRLSFLQSEVPFLYEPAVYRGLHLADCATSQR